MARFSFAIVLGLILVGAILFGFSTQTRAEVPSSFGETSENRTPKSIEATTWYVAEVGDDGNSCTSWGAACATIAGAVGKAIDGDTIEVAAGTYHEHDIEVYKQLTINGTGASTIVDADASGRAFYNGSTVLISNMRLQNGQTTSGPNFAGSGGAVFNAGTLTLQNVDMVDNHAATGGGAVFNLNTITLNQVEIFSNTAASAGGGVYGINNSVITITESTIAHNLSEGGSSGGGGVHNFGISLLIEDSAIYHNQANYFGGGLYIFLSGQAVLNRVTLFGNQGNDAAGLYIGQGMVTATNVTISNNTASNNYGGIYLTGAATSLFLQNSTIAQNNRTNTVGTGFNGIATGNNATAFLVNSILANNQNKNCSNSTSLTSLGYNLSSDFSCGLSQTGDLQGTDPLLGPLAENGGWDQTHSLLPGSPAIDAGDDAQCPATDARGINRPFDGDGDGNAVCDIGAVETRYQLSIADSSVTEGDSGSVTAVFTVTLAPTSTVAVEVDYDTSDGTAQAGSDYTTISDTLTFNPGETVKYIQVPVLGDTNDEADETFRVTLSSPLNADLLDAEATGTIVDNDGLSSLTISNQTVLEGNTGTTVIEFTVSLSPPSAAIVSVDYVLADGTAEAGIDYTAISDTLTFNPGETEQTISVDVLGDVIDEGSSENFSVQLSNPVNANIAVGTAAGTITDDDTAQLRAQAGPSVLEGNVGMTPAVFTVTLSTPADFVITVDYETTPGYGEDGATAGEDFVPISGTLTFQPGETAQTYTVQVIGDTDGEPDEYFSSLLSNANVPVSPNSSFAYILNDDFRIYLPLVIK